MNGNPLDTDSLSIDTRKEIPVTYPVLDRGIRSPTRHGMNPWNTILHPRAQPTTEAVVKKISKAQSPTTSRAANRIRRQKVLERQAAEEEEASKKGGVAYARMKREKASNEAQAKRERDNAKSHHAKHTKSAKSAKSVKSDKHDKQSTKHGKQAKHQASSSSSSKKNNGTTDRKLSASSAPPAPSTKRATTRPASTVSKSRGRSSSTTSTAGARRRAAGAGMKSRPSKIPTPKKMRQLKTDADAQESIRALIDKVTIEFERMPSTVPDEDGEEVDRNVQSVLWDVEQKLGEETGRKRRATSRVAAKEEGESSSSSSSRRNIAGARGGELEVRESIDLESVRVGIEMNHKEVDREEAELLRRTQALEEDMKKLKERKLKLHLAKYEHELRSSSKDQLEAITKASENDMQAKTRALKERTKKQLDSIAEFDNDLKMKIQRLIMVR